MTNLIQSLAVDNHNRKNAIINGNFDIWQRGTSISFTNTTNLYTADRWRTEGHNFTGTVSQLPLALGEIEGATNAMRWNVTTSATGLPIALTQRIEAEPYVKLSNREITISFWIKGSSTFSATEIILLTGGGVVDISTQITATWTKITHTFTMNDRTAQPYTTIGVQMGNNVIGQLDIAQFQVEIGSLASEFEQRTWGEELALCQRYYEKSYEYANAPGTVTQVGMVRNCGITNLPTLAYVINNYNQFKVRKRASATTFVYSPNTAAIQTISNIDAGNVDLAITALVADESGFDISATFPAQTSIRVGYHYTADAEL